jgi:hypothetical protein
MCTRKIELLSFLVLHGALTKRLGRKIASKYERNRVRAYSRFSMLAQATPSFHFLLKLFCRSF